MLIYLTLLRLDIYENGSQSMRLKLAIYPNCHILAGIDGVHSEQINDVQMNAGSTIKVTVLIMVFYNREEFGFTCTLWQFTGQCLILEYINLRSVRFLPFKSYNGRDHIILLVVLNPACT